MKFKLAAILFIISTSIFAQSLAGIKICIDPGHGGHSSDDRFIEATGFWESDGNWAKAQYTKEILEELGATVIVTRQGNTDADDLPLSTRAGIANSNNVDFFHSIHSNGFQGTSNYTVMLYNGTDTSPTFAAAKTMGSIMSVKIKDIHRTTAAYNRADQSFLGYNLGVLRPLTMPGTLSEGSFHDYVPESWRLRNDVYKKHEGWAIARAFLQFYNAGSTTYGEIAGLLRDPNQSVSYFSISGTGDNKKPLNYINVKLEPGGLEYDGDDYNNGFYLFDELEPGQYKLYFTAEDYSVDSAEVTVQANKTVFKDMNLSLIPNMNIPQIVDFMPSENSEDNSLKSNIEINFDISMNTSITQSSISISPSISGSYEWSENNRKVVFTPNVNLQAGTEYTVTVAATAQSVFGVSTGSNNSYKFSTRSKLNILSVYPANNSADISTTAILTIQFDAPISSGTLTSNIQLLDENDVFPQVGVDVSQYQYGRIVFWSLDPFDNNMEYRIILGSGLGDIEGLTLENNFEYKFTTEDSVTFAGNIFDEFETENWIQPSDNTSSNGIVTDNTNFILTDSKKISGASAGFLNYEFADSNGICVLENKNIYELGSNTDSELAIWIFGDLSQNLLEYRFKNSAGDVFNVLTDTINWNGWKLKMVNVANAGISGDARFDGITIKQSINGNISGNLYFDDAQYSGSVTGIENKDEISNIKFALRQNYPNPFNPSTQIQFSIPQNTIVNLKIYNSIGQLIKTLVRNGELSEGLHSVIWNGDTDGGAKVSSGIYFYSINAGDFRSVKKMVLLR